jgi:ribulose-phosphate 3-epimerase
MKIIPAILPLRYYDIPNGVEKISGAVNTVQIDFVDGHFAPNRNWWFNNKDEERLTALLNQDEGLPEWESMNYEFDLMVKDPLEHMDIFMALGPSKIIFHIESLDQEKTLAYFEQLPGIIKDTITFGIAIGIDTDPALVTPYLPYIDTIQCMGIVQVGYQGQPFDDRVIAQVTKVKNLFPDKTVSVDGGVTRDSAVLLAQAGVDALVVGSLVFQSSDPQSTIGELKRLCHLAITQHVN